MNLTNLTARQLRIAKWWAALLTITLTLALFANGQMELVYNYYIGR